jgi:hypothetical protein
MESKFFLLDEQIIPLLLFLEKRRPPRRKLRITFRKMRIDNIGQARGKEFKVMNL